MSIHLELFQLDAKTLTVFGSVFAPLYLHCLLLYGGENISRGKSHFLFRSLPQPLSNARALTLTVFQGRRRGASKLTSVVRGLLCCKGTGCTSEAGEHLLGSLNSTFQNLAETLESSNSLLLLSAFIPINRCR